MNYRSAANKFTCEQVTDYSNEDGDPLVIGSSKVEGQFKLATEFPNLFPKIIPTEFLPLREVNHHEDPKPVSQWLPAWKPSAHKLEQQRKNKLNTEVESGHMYIAPKNQNAIVRFCVAMRD